MKTVKIAFQLETEEGFPPVAVETLNAGEREDGSFELLNTPFFVQEVAYGDIVRARRSDEGRLEFESCIQPSTYKAIAVILLHPDARQRLIDSFDWKDCIVEYGEVGGYRMLAIGIPDTVDYRPVKALLDLCENEERLSYAELVA